MNFMFRFSNHVVQGRDPTRSIANTGDRCNGADYLAGRFLYSIKYIEYTKYKSEYKKMQLFMFKYSNPIHRHDTTRPPTDTGDRCNGTDNLAGRLTFLI